MLLWYKSTARKIERTVLYLLVQKEFNYLVQNQEYVLQTIICFLL